MADYAILANPEGSAWDFAKNVYESVKDKLVRDASRLEIELIEIEVQKFRDKEIKPKIKENIREKTCFFIHDSSLEPAQWFLQLALINNAIKYASAGKIINVLPYLLFSRQDRKDEPRTSLSAIEVARIQRCDRVITIDVHSPQIANAYNVPFDNLYSFPYAIDYIFNKHKELLKEDLAIMSPDAGGVERAKAFMNRLAKKYNKVSDLITGYKHRPRAGEISEYRIIGDVKNKNILIIDDILDSGGTLTNAAKKLKESGASKIYAYITHGIFTKGFDELRKYFDKVFISNTRKINIDDEKLEVIDLSGLVAEAIYRIITRKSLSELFE